MRYLVLFARGRTSFDQWLDDNPMILGLGAIGIGLAIGGWGLVEFISGTAHDKWGNKMEGFQGRAMATVRMVFGAAAILFGLYKMMFG